MKDNTVIAKDYTNWHVKHGGFARDMTLRDHFAAVALQGLLTAETVGEYSNEHVVEIACVLADAMIKERAK